MTSGAWRSKFEPRRGEGLSIRDAIVWRRRLNARECSDRVRLSRRGRGIVTDDGAFDVIEGFARRQIKFAWILETERRQIDKLKVFNRKLQLHLGNFRHDVERRLAHLEQRALWGGTVGGGENLDHGVEDFCVGLGVISGFVSIKPGGLEFCRQKVVASFRESGVLVPRKSLEACLRRFEDQQVFNSGTQNKFFATGADFDDRARSATGDKAVGMRPALHAHALPGAFGEAGLHLRDLFVSQKMLADNDSKILVARAEAFFRQDMNGVFESVRRNDEAIVALSERIVKIALQRDRNFQFLEPMTVFFPDNFQHADFGFAVIWLTEIHPAWGRYQELRSDYTLNLSRLSRRGTKKQRAAATGGRRGVEFSLEESEGGREEVGAFEFTSIAFAIFAGWSRIKSHDGFLRSGVANAIRDDYDWQLNGRGVA